MDAVRVVEGLRRAARVLRAEAHEHHHPGSAQRSELMVEADELEQLAKDYTADKVDAARQVGRL